MSTKTLKDTYYIDEYKIGADDYGNSPYVDLTIGHPDGFVIHVNIRSPWDKEDVVSIETTLL